MAFGVGISHYSRLNGVNQDLVEFRRGIGGALGSLMPREDEDWLPAAALGIQL